MSWPPSSSSNTPCVSFIGIVDFSQEARWLYMTDSVADLLGFEPKELIGRPSLELVHPDEFPRVRQLHYDTIQMDKAAVLVYLRLRHKDPYKGYILCGISRTVVHNVLVGSVSFASPGAKALHNASTAQEITVISQSAANFEFRRWHDPSPMPPSPTLAPAKLPPSPTSSSSSSTWSSPSPPMAPSTVPNISNSRNEVHPSRQYNDDEFEPERSPSPITGRPRPRRLINRNRSNGIHPPNIPNRQQVPFSPTPTNASNGYASSPSPPSGSVITSPRYRSDSPGPTSLGRRLSGSTSSPSRSMTPESSPTAYDRSPLVERPNGIGQTPRRDTNGNGQPDECRYSQNTGNNHHEHYRDSSEPRLSRTPPQRAVAPAPPAPRSQPAPPSVITFDHLPNKSFRTAFIVDRFSLNCTILYCSNDLLVESTHAIGRNFFDFVAAKDEGIVRSWIECVKGWGVNERGQPSDGGFGFGRFTLLVGGRESTPRLPDPVQTTPRHRQGSMNSRTGSGPNGAPFRGSRNHSHREHYYSNGSRSITGNGNGPTTGTTAAYFQQRLGEFGEQFPVDAIFSAHSDGLMIILRRTQ